MPSITITVTTPVAARVATAVGRLMFLTTAPGVFRDATLSEVTEYTRGLLREKVLSAERHKAQEAILISPIDLAT
jgi:hypothetical protein